MHNKGVSTGCEYLEVLTTRRTMLVNLKYPKHVRSSGVYWMAVLTLSPRRLLLTTNLFGGALLLLSLLVITSARVAYS
jgi:hypothetical protein